MVAKVGAKFRLSFIAHNSISTVKYAKIVFLCFSEEKEKGGSFSSVADYIKSLLKPFYSKHSITESLCEMESQAPPTG